MVYVRYFAAAETITDVYCGILRPCKLNEIARYSAEHPKDQDAKIFIEVQKALKSYKSIEGRADPATCIWLAKYSHTRVSTTDC